jgi:CMP-N-acetylneuraminic acid synthetase
MPKVSIVIRTKNEERWIGACLTSVFGQDFKDFEVIVVDNESQDKTVEKAKQFNVKVINYSGEFRPGKAINEGIRNSSGKYIVCLSGHCVPVNNQWLTSLVEDIKSPEAAGVYGRQEPFSFSSAFDKRDLMITFGLDKKIQTKDSFFHNANSIIKKSVWEEIPFNEEVTHIEDRVWAREVLKRGYKIIYEPKASVYHYHGIHQNGDSKRCQEIVEILEKLDENIRNQTLDINHLKIVGIVPIKGKMDYLGGKPLIEYTLKRALESKYLEKVAVTTDNPEIGDFSKKMGADVFMRPSELSADYVELQEVLKHAVGQFEKDGIIPDIVVFLSPTYPFRPKGLIDQSIFQLIKGGYDSVMPVLPEYRSCWSEEGEKIKRIDKGFIPSKFKEPLYIGISGLVVAVHADVIRRGEDKLGNKVGMLKLDDIVCSIDVGKAKGNKIAELLIKDWWLKNQ